MPYLEINADQMPPELRAMLEAAAAEQERERDRIPMPSLGDALQAFSPRGQQPKLFSIQIDPAIMREIAWLRMGNDASLGRG